MNNPWDALSRMFDTNKEEGEISPSAADNILIAWPPMLDFIDKNKPAGTTLRALDFGCGGGSFAKKLYDLGFQVTGVDTSEEMIRVAKKAFGNSVDFLQGDTAVLQTLPKLHIITAVMVLQFIEDIDQTIAAFSKILLPGGILVFAVHNQEHIKDYLQANMLFEEFDSVEHPKNGFLSLSGKKISIFLRTANEYNKLLKEKGFEPLFEAYPSFTKEFLTKYPVSGPVDHPRFLILGYKKQ